MKWKPTIAGYEAMGQQSLLEDPIHDAAELAEVTCRLRLLP